MTIDEIIDQISTEVNDARERENRSRREIDNLIASAEREGRANLTADEDRRSQQLFRDIDHAKAAQKRSLARLDRAHRVQAEDAEADRLSRQVHDTGAVPPASRTASFSVTRNERTYSPGTDPTGTNFVRDVARAHVMGDAEAYSRLARHMQEERVERPQYAERAAGDLTTAGSGGLVVPQYLVDLTAPAVATRRPLADNMTSHQLPSTGMSFVVPTITTATSAAVQATQLTSVSSTSLNETDLTVNVQTAAGSQNVARQAIDRGRVDEFVVADLMARYASALDSQLINQASVGLSAVCASTLGAFTSTSPTGALLYPKILACQSGVEATLLGVPADMVVMHSRRWAWLSKEMTSTWPLINSQGIPEHAAGVSTNAAYGPGYRGVLPNGMRVIVDNNVPTNISANQDEIYVVPSAECHLWEDQGAPILIRAEQPNAPALGVLIVVYGYFAATFQRYPSGAMQVIRGAGLTTPTF
jgi:HK97 family phage major capsid protein